MKKYLLAALAALSLAMFSLSDQALADSNDVRTLILSNELISANQGGLIDGLIAGGHGSKSLYQILQLLVAQPGNGIPADFVTSVANNPPGSQVFTVPLSNFAGLNNPVGINADGTFIIQPIFGRDYDGEVGYVTNFGVSGIGLVWYTLASNSSNFIDTGAPSGAGPNHLAIGIAWIKSRDARTFFLSNEAPGALMDKLIAAGHGSESLYQILQYLAAQPGSGIPVDFVTGVGSHPGSDAHMFPLSTFADPSNNPVGIADDGSLTIAGLYGRDLVGQVGYVTNTVPYPGIGLARITMATSPAYYIDAGADTDASVGQTFYKGIGVAWAGAVGSTAIPSLNGWGMSLLAMALAGAALFYLRKRQGESS